MEKSLICFLIAGMTMLAQNKASRTLELQHPKGKVSPTLYGLIYLKVINASTQPLDLTVKPKESSSLFGSATLWVLKRESAAQTNLIERPNTIVPSQTQIKCNAEQHFAPLYVNVVELRQGVQL